ncbi:hypothetical protein M5K25_010099 [Dendrobium thyrsiflorum]|uniref:Uncharacterized protein n=1 Tax=Dendrobium thyrsiflorum TaxID=117978 RepID=A0ABD0UZE9_DENTH
MRCKRRLIQRDFELDLRDMGGSSTVREVNRKQAWLRFSTRTANTINLAIWSEVSTETVAFWPAFAVNSKEEQSFLPLDECLR